MKQQLSSVPSQRLDAPCVVKQALEAPCVLKHGASTPGPARDRTAKTGGTAAKAKAKKAKAKKKAAPSRKPKPSKSPVTDQAEKPVTQPGADTAPPATRE